MVIILNRKNLKKAGLMFVSVIIVVCFVYGLNMQPAVFGNEIGSLTERSFVTDSDVDLNSFDSYENFTKFLRNNTNIRFDHGYDPFLLKYSGVGPEPFMVDDVQLDADWSNVLSGAEESGGNSVDWSQTNVQVTGVDEPDIVKTDGTYLYIVSNNKVLIVLAVPAEDAEIIAKIEIDTNQTIKNIFIDEGRIIVLSESYYNPIIYQPMIDIDVPVIQEDVEISSQVSSVSIMPRRYSYSPESHIQIFDSSDIKNPSLLKDVVVGGNIAGARLIGDYVYLVTNQYSYNVYPYYEIAQDEFIPAIKVDGELVEVPLSNIQYFDTYERNNAITNIVSVNINDETEEVTSKIFLLGNSQLLYVYTNNIYITYTKQDYDYNKIKEIVEEVLTPYLPESILEEFELVKTLSISDYQKQEVCEWILQNFSQNMDQDLKANLSLQIMKRIHKTIIHRIAIYNGEIEYAAQGEVPGYANGQFSMNEYDGHFRISTTLESWRISNYMSNVQSQNNIYVLDMSLEIVGSLEGLAPGESIYATRFLGDKCYLVTFRQIDPFFVIDMSNPENPFVEGELKIPGYSTYLHPYDDTHVIGIGRNGNSIKVALYDVTDVANPIEMSKYEITIDHASWWNVQSDALYEHKAFLFDIEKNLLVIPAGTYNKQSAYVFNIDLENGVLLKGNVTHESLDQMEPKDDDSYWYGYYDYGYSIKRTLYIGDVLYTISDNMVKMNDLGDLSEINSIDLN